ncbi:MAG TPA: cytochrome C [Gallionellaceae bacterium]
MRNLVLSLSLMALPGACLALNAQMPPLAEEAGCARCHAIDQPVVGPAWIDVSKRYRDSRNNPATFSQLVERVSKGGEGNWGKIPMTPSDPTGKRLDKIQELVKFILSLSDQLPEYQARAGK